MIKLLQLISEIKFVNKITRQMVLNAWFSFFDNSANDEYMSVLDYFLNRYGTNQVISDFIEHRATQEQLEEMYKYLTSLPLSEIKFYNKIDAKTVGEEWHQFVLKNGERSDIVAATRKYIQNRFGAGSVMHFIQNEAGPNQLMTLFKYLQKLKNVNLDEIKLVNRPIVAKRKGNFGYNPIAKSIVIPEFGDAMLHYRGEDTYAMTFDMENYTDEETKDWKTEEGYDDFKQFLDNKKVKYIEGFDYDSKLAFIYVHKKYITIIE